MVSCILAGMMQISDVRLLFFLLTIESQVLPVQLTSSPHYPEDHDVYDDVTKSNHSMQCTIQLTEFNDPTLLSDISSFLSDSIFYGQYRNDSA